MRPTLVFALLAAAACSSSSSTPPGQPTAPAPAPGEPEEPAPILEAPRAALGYLPADADLVFGVDLAALMSAPVLAPYRDDMLAESPSELRELRERCNLDPFSDIRWVVFGANSKSERGVMVLRGDFTTEAIERCLLASKATVESVADGAIKRYAIDNDKLYVRWLGPGAAVATSDEAGGVDALERALSGGGLPLDVVKRVELIDSGSHLWVVSGAEAFAGSPLQGATGVRLFASASDVLSFGLVVDFVDASTADATKGQIDMALGSVGAMAPELVPIAESLQLSVSGSSLEARLELDAAKMKIIADFINKQI